MPSLIPGFEYDVFISYRQNDNRSGWVTEFVKNLKEEVAATIKEPVTIYFDVNPYDGLLETYDVDDSLRNKVKSFIFIPIISQTYCDPKSFAWQHEFLAFKKSANEDQQGIKIKLANGNVASRILPVSIHELDPEDKQLLESELGGVRRGIEFIYKTAGVARPLNAVEEDAKANLNHTFYRDQLNKLARTIKELVASQHERSAIGDTSMKVKEMEVPREFRKKIAVVALAIGILGLLSFTYYYFGGFGKRIGVPLDRSIAVLPFENMNDDPEQDYFSNGITEDILNHLARISDLKVKSRTSTLQYKGTQKSMTIIGEELGVANVVEGSIRRVGNQVRIVVQLIDAESDIHLWSETYDRELKDVLALQREIAMEIANALKARLTDVEKETINKEVSQNITAYDYYLRSRDIINNANLKKKNFENALILLNQAVHLDSTFSQAYALKANVWFELSAYGIKQSVWMDSVLSLTSKAIATDPKSPDGYVTRGRMYRYLGELEKSKSDFYTAFKLAPNSADVLLTYGFQLLNEFDEKGADLVLRSYDVEYSIKDPEYYLSLTEAYFFVDDFATQEKLLTKSKGLNPGSNVAYRSLGYLYMMAGDYKKALIELEQAEEISPDYQGVVDDLAWAHYMNNDFENAAKCWGRYKAIEAKFDDSTQTVPFRHRLGMTYIKMGKKKEAETLFKEDLKIQTELLAAQRGIGAWGGASSIYYDLAIDNSFFGDYAKAVQYLDSALDLRFTWKWGLYHDPMLDPLRQREDFKKLMRRVDTFYEFRKRAFSNALSRMEANKDLKTLLK